MLSPCPVGCLSLVKLNWDSQQGRDLATSGCNKQKFQLGQSYSYIMRKVWYHQIWIQFCFGFIVLILIKMSLKWAIGSNLEPFRILVSRLTSIENTFCWIWLFFPYSKWVGLALEKQPWSRLIIITQFFFVYNMINNMRTNLPKTLDQLILSKFY